MYRFIIFFFLLINSFKCSETGVQSPPKSLFNDSVIYGITIDGINPINDITASLSSLPVRMTTRIVFDKGQSASDYIYPVSKIHEVSNVMGEIVDSYYMKDYTVQQYSDRISEYLPVLVNGVDIWEIGNEVNGEWLGPKREVITKIQSAYKIIKIANRKTAVTLYYNKDCFDNPENEMFRWVNENMSDSMKSGLDYVFVSYYEDDCNGNLPNWQNVFDSLHAIFPNSKLGIGECGTEKPEKKNEYMNRYYNMKITTPNYVGGYFWWYYRQDCVPKTKALWLTLNNILKK